MKSYTHITAGVLFVLIIFYLLDIPTTFIGIFFGGWISVWPNIVDRMTNKSRGWGHSVLWLIPFILIGFYNSTVSLALVVGFLSHLLLDCFTIYGCPFLYPLKKSGFVCLHKKRRLETGKNADKALFIFLLFMVVPLFLFSTGLGNITEDQLNLAYATNNSSPVTGLPENNIYMSFKVDEACEKNITVERVNENKTSIVVSDLEKEE
jgi:inner membrane protein